MLIYQSAAGHITIVGGGASRTVIAAMVKASGVHFYRVDHTRMVGYTDEIHVDDTTRCDICGYRRLHDQVKRIGDTAVCDTCREEYTP